MFLIGKLQELVENAWWAWRVAIPRRVDALYEMAQDMSRDKRIWHPDSELHVALQALGVQASMSERGRPEERVTSWRGGRTVGTLLNNVTNFLRY